MESRILDDQLEQLAQIDQQINTITALRDRYSLAPERKRARSLVEVYQHVLGPTGSVEMAEVLGQGLSEIASAQLENFPENLFWDYEWMAVKIAEYTQTTSFASAQQLCTKIAHIHHLYGRKTPICFRYVHDFTYGFDWAKWVCKDPQNRASIGPFDIRFIQWMEQRGHELLALIEQNDAKYPRLDTGEARNPFGFSRQPPDELRLHRHLAGQKLIPVAAWNFTARPQWQLNYIQLRSDEAWALGLGIH